MTYTYELVGSNGDHIYFDGSTAFSVNRDTLSGISGHPVTVNYVQAPGQVGVTPTHDTVSMRVISLDVSIIGAGRADLEAKRRRLVRALNPLSGFSRLVWNSEIGSWYVRCKPAAGSPSFGSGTKPSAKEWRCGLSLLAFDPAWYSATEIQVPLTGFTGGFSLPLQFPASFGVTGTNVEITNGGDIETPCIIELNGMVRNPSIELETTGETLTYLGTVGAGEKLIINTAFGSRSATLIDEYGVGSNAMHYMSPSSKFFQLPAGDFRLLYTAAEEDAGATGYIKYTERCLSL